MAFAAASATEKVFFVPPDDPFRCELDRDFFFEVFFFEVVFFDFVAVLVFFFDDVVAAVFFFFLAVVVFFLVVFFFLLDCFFVDAARLAVFFFLAEVGRDFFFDVFFFDVFFFDFVFVLRAEDFFAVLFFEVRPSVVVFFFVELRAERDEAARRLEVFFFVVVFFLATEGPSRCGAVCNALSGRQLAEAIRPNPAIVVLRAEIVNLSHSRRGRWAGDGHRSFRRRRMRMITVFCGTRADTDPRSRR